MQATMVHHMSEGMVARYKERTTAIMIWNNMSEIRCPCHRCNLRALIKPDFGTLEKHLLMSGFMKGYNEGEDLAASRSTPFEGGRMMRTSLLHHHYLLLLLMKMLL
jgi:hypothetical protein